MMELINKCEQNVFFSGDFFQYLRLTETSTSLLVLCILMFFHLVNYFINERYTHGLRVFLSLYHACTGENLD